MRRLQVQRAMQAHPPIAQAQSRNPGQKVEIEIDDAGGAVGRRGARNVGRAMPPPKQLQFMVVERLCAQADAVDTGGGHPAQPRGRDGPGIGFHAPFPAPADMLKVARSKPANSSHWAGGSREGVPPPM